MTTIDDEIAEVLRQLEEGKRHIDKQNALIVEVKASGGSIAEAQVFLARLEEAQQLYVGQLGRLKKQNAQGSPCPNA